MFVSSTGGNTEDEGAAVEDVEELTGFVALPETAFVAAAG
jgi:hypothetical protein